MSKNKSGGNHRSAVSGRYVKTGYGKSHPKTTVKEERGGGTTGRSRSAVTGQFVKEGYAKKHPRTTVKES